MKQLFFQYTVKLVPEPLLSEWEIGVISGISCCFEYLLYTGYI